MCQISNNVLRCCSIYIYIYVYIFFFFNFILFHSSHPIYSLSSLLLCLFLFPILSPLSTALPHRRSQPLFEPVWSHTADLKLHCRTEAPLLKNAYTTDLCLSYQPVLILIQLWLVLFRNFFIFGGLGWSDIGGLRWLWVAMCWFWRLIGGGSLFWGSGFFFWTKKKRGRSDQRDNLTWSDYNNILPLGRKETTVSITSQPHKWH